jgi:hypothetical protein
MKWKTEVLTEMNVVTSDEGHVIQVIDQGPDRWRVMGFAPPVQAGCMCLYDERDIEGAGRTCPEVNAAGRRAQAACLAYKP